MTAVGDARKRRTEAHQIHPSPAVCDLVAREVAAAKAEVLREAADEMSRCLDGFPQQGRHTRARWAEGWLRYRADRIEPKP